MPAPRLLKLLLFTVVVSQAAHVAAADNPTAGLLAGHNQTSPIQVLSAGTTKLGTLNANGDGVFNLRNGSGKAITSAMVVIEASAPVKTLGYGCSMFNALLKTCAVEVNGAVITMRLSGSPEITPDGEFRVGFSPGTIAGAWPAGASVSVTVSDQAPAPPR